MRFANIFLLIVTFIASVTLLTLMQRRKLMRRLYLFVALMLLYIVRAAVLLIGVKLFNPTAYFQVASVLSLFDLVFQLTLAFWLARRLTQPQFGVRAVTGRRIRNSAGILFVAGLLIAAALTTLLVFLLPSYSPVPLDRGIVFTGLVFLFLLVALERSENTVEGRLLLGFCIVSAANILSQCGRMLAAAQHNPRLFLICAYANTLVWVGVLLFWILRLQTTSPAPRPVTGGAPVMAS